MLDGSRPIRRPTQRELALLRTLVSRATGLRITKEWQSALSVVPMSDGKMGSLKLMPIGARADRRFGKRVSEYTFRDEDDVVVIVSLNVDEEGELYELDIWKTNFQPLIRLPQETE